YHRFIHSTALVRRRRKGTLKVSTCPCNACMNTKRCVYCHKLSPVDARSCIHCSRPFARTTGPGRRLDSGGTPTMKHSRSSRSRRASIPPASLHHAGHHPGLHPEDQPYQSSVMSIQHPPKPKTAPLNGASQASRRPSRQELEKRRLAAAATEPA